MEPSELRRALKTFHDQFTTFKTISIQEKARLQKQLDLANERNGELEGQLADKTREVHELKQKLAEQTTRKEELEIMRSLEAAFAEFQESWSSEEADGTQKSEDGRSKSIDIGLPKRPVSRGRPQVPTRYVFTII